MDSFQTLCNDVGTEDKLQLSTPRTCSVRTCAVDAWDSFIIEEKMLSARQIFTPVPWLWIISQISDTFK